MTCEGGKHRFKLILIYKSARPYTEDTDLLLSSVIKRLHMTFTA